MSVGAVGASSAPELQTSWTRAEAACAARHRGDVYYELMHPAPKADPTPAPASTSASTSTGDPAPTPLAPGFTLHL